MRLVINKFHGMALVFIISLPEAQEQDATQNQEWWCNPSVSYRLVWFAKSTFVLLRTVMQYVQLSTTIDQSLLLGRHARMFFYFLFHLLDLNTDKWWGFLQAFDSYRVLGINLEFYLHNELTLHIVRANIMNDLFRTSFPVRVLWTSVS